MQTHDETPDRPLNELFGAWWLGTFCSEPEHFVLIDNLVPSGVGSLLYMLVRGSAELGPESALAAQAALPFVKFLHARTPFADEAAFAEAIGALETIERFGSAGSDAWQFQVFMKKFDKE
ncbi:MAG: hypothetical protein KF691_06045 [Phycisphaeraceae bacterium]|nr:hypothetical protein [Phycisphaeraceae bacterium]